VFSDNFDSDILGLNQTSFLQGWQVSNGTVDVIGSGFFDFIPSHTRYIDLDGSTSQAGLFSKNLSLNAGQTYTATFELAGSQRGSNESVLVNFGASSQVYALSSASGFSSFTLNFTPSSTGLYSLSFKNAGGDNIGALLDNVVVTAVPEPETFALFALGLGTLLLGRRRR
jgi:hypothetical protein